MAKKVKLLNFMYLFSTIVIILLCAPRFTDLSLQELLAFTPESPALAALALLGIYCLKAFVMFIPLTVLYLGAGVLFPVGWAFILTYFCLIVETSIGFFLGRRLGRKRMVAFFNRSERGKKLLEFGNKNSIFSCFIIRMIPGPPIEVTNMFVGATDIKYLHFIVGTLLGYTPGMIPLVLMGAAAADPLSMEFLIPFALCIVTTLFVAGGFFWRHVRAKRYVDE